MSFIKILQKYSLLFILILVYKTSSGQVSNDSIVTQKIIYKTTKTTEFYLLWTMNNWTIPGVEYQPEGSFIKDGMAYSKMSSAGDHFYIELRLPKGIYIDFMFWATKDSVGEKADGWDTHWGGNYNLYISGEKIPKIIDDSKLAFTQLKAETKSFNILKNGRQIFLVAILLLLAGYLVYTLANRKFTVPRIRLRHYLIGIVFATYLIMVLVRLQMNGYMSSKQILLFGITYYDFIFLSLFSLIALGLLLITKKYKYIHLPVISLTIILLIIIVSMSVMNIEMVRQLGQPLNYSWLYYSDFLTGIDAKNALKQNINSGFKENMILIISAVMIAGYAFSLLLKPLAYNYKKELVAVSTFAVFIFIISLVQFRSNKFSPGKVENPVYVLASSWMQMETKPQIFDMKVSEKVMQKITDMHRSKTYEQVPGLEKIDNIVLFVLESTSKNMVQVYDSSFMVTPYLNKWKSNARIYTNFYAHVPNTVNSMFSIISGFYPMISYKVAVKEKPDIQIPSLAAGLKQNGWNTSVFFSSDLSYSSLDQYLINQQIEIVDDYKTIKCSEYEKFTSNYAQLDGLDDRCIVDRYFKWSDNLKDKKKFSVLWTNQTHYPYFYSGPEEKYTANLDHNRYLSALKNSDRAFNNLMEGLRQRNLLENSLIIVIGDHGEAFGSHGQFGHATKIYEVNLNVPCMIINPGIYKGEFDDRVGGMVDIAPTIMHALNIKSPREWQGTSLLYPVKNNCTFFIGPYSDFLFGVRDGNWKYIYNSSVNEHELYDISTDGEEKKNIADQHKSVVKQKYELIAAWAQYHGKKLGYFLK